MRLVRFNYLTLKKAVDLNKAAEQTEHRMKLMGWQIGVNSLTHGSPKWNRALSPPKPLHVAKATEKQLQTSRVNCTRCGTRHTKKKCPAFGQKCHWCGNLNHFQSHCQNKITAIVKEDNGECEICVLDEEPNVCARKALVKLFVKRKQARNQVQFQTRIH